MSYFNYISSTSGKSGFNAVQKQASKLPQNDSAIISQLATEFTDRSRKDIQKWRHAIQHAEHPLDPRWVAFQDLLVDLETDGHLQGDIQVRKLAVLSGKYKIIDASGAEVEEKTKLLKKSWFYVLLNDLLDSTYYAYSVCELVDINTKEFRLIPRRNCVPQRKGIFLSVMNTTPVDYSLNPYVIELKSIRNLGILNDIVPQLIWKRNAQQTWADFCEKFGIPLVTAKTNQTDKKTLDRIETMLRALGQASQALFPEGTTIDVLGQSQTGDPHQVFDAQINRCNSEISKRILSGTMLTDNGSSRSQSEVHERNLDDKIAESDKTIIEFTINDKLLPILRRLGMPFDDTDQFVFDRSENLSMPDQWKIVNEALQFFEIDPAWIEKRFGLPITALKPASVLAPGSVSKDNPKAAFTANFH